MEAAGDWGGGQRAVWVGCPRDPVIWLDTQSLGCDQAPRERHGVFGIVRLSIYNVDNQLLDLQPNITLRQDKLFLILDRKEEKRW